MNNNKKGFAMVFVLMITSLLFIFGISLLGLTLSEYRITYAYADISKAEYLAESGLNKVRYAFEEKGTDNNYKIKNNISSVLSNNVIMHNNNDKTVVGNRIKGTNNEIKNVLNNISLIKESNDGFYTGSIDLNGGKIYIKAKVDEITDTNNYGVKYYKKNGKFDYENEYELQDGIDHNNYYHFIVYIESEGIYGGITRKGTANIIFDFNNSNPSTVDLMKIE